MQSVKLKLQVQNTMTCRMRDKKYDHRYQRLPSLFAGIVQISDVKKSWKSKIEILSSGKMN